jgi:hypothetical protein
MGDGGMAVVLGAVSVYSDGTPNSEGANVNLNACERRDWRLGISVSINNSINNYLYLIDVTLSGILLM